MLLVGLTGNIGAGKSTVAETFARKGIGIVDADVLARDAVAPGTPQLGAIMARWGDRVRAADGSLDRKALRRIVFGDDAEREALNAIVHPRVEELRAALVADARARGNTILICAIPLLYEKTLAGQFDRVILVDAPPAVRTQRLVRDRGMDPQEAAAMIDAQMPADTKRGQADYVIDNAGTHAQLEQKTLDVWRALVQDAERKRTN